MPDIVANSHTSLEAGVRTRKIELRYVAWFSLFVLAGGMGTLYPMLSLVFLAAVTFLGICWRLCIFLGHAGLELWQVIALTTLSGYLVLNYGFDNLALHVSGFPVLIGYGMAYASLGLALYASRDWLFGALHEPALLCLLAVLVLSIFHLLTDIPAFGSWAFRDCTMCFDGLFVLMGLLWARNRNSSYFLAKWLLVIFVVNMFYSFTLPWGTKVWSWSPVSGVYLPVPLLGHYHGTGDILMAGAMFCICVGNYLVSRPRWLMPLLALGQLLGIAVTQIRRMYLGIVVLIVILVLAGEVKKFARLFLMVPAAIAVLFLVTSVGGVEISGRVGPVNLEFFKDHIRSLTGAEDTPGSDPQTRVIMGRQAMQHFFAHPVFGEGFGRPVVDVIDEETDTATRTPHNSSITYLARMGAIGFTIWMAFHLCLWTRFAYVFRRRSSCDKRLYALVLWFFLYYVIFMMSSLVESPFEYPASAIPFYFLMGFALGLMRWHFASEKEGQHRGAGFAKSVEQAYS